MSRLILALLIMGLVILYSLLNISHAFHPTDDGKILAYAWRIVHGEVPYRDFVYIRPPLSPYLATTLLMFPDAFIFRAGRVWYFFQMVASCLLPLLLIPRELLVNGKLYALAIGIGFIFVGITIHNFPPMPWHTIDGIFFATIALVCLKIGLSSSATKLTPLVVFFGGISSTFSFLARQNFGLIPIFFATALLISVFHGRHPKRWSILITGISGVILPAIVFFCALVHTNSYSPFLEQVLKASENAPLIELGFWNYAFSPLNFSICFLVGCMSTFCSYPNRGQTRYSQIGGILEYGIMLGYMIYSVSLENFDISFYLFWFLTGASLVLFLSKIATDPSLSLYCMGSILLAWSSSISIGYPWPIMGVGPSSLVVFLATHHSFSTATSGSKLLKFGTLLVLCLLSFSSLFASLNLYVKKPYRDSPRNEQLYDLSVLLPKFGTLYTNINTYKIFEGLDKLYGRMAGPLQNRNRIVIIPNFPIWYFITGTENPVSLDWIQPMEIRNQSERIISELDSRANIAIIECRELSGDGACKREAQPSKVSSWILAKWIPCDQEGTFVAYKNPMVTTYRP